MNTTNPATSQPTGSEASPLSGWRGRVSVFIEHRRFQQIIIGLILINAVLLGLETSPDLMARTGGLIIAIDRASDTARAHIEAELHAEFRAMREEIRALRQDISSLHQSRQQP